MPSRAGGPMSPFLRSDVSLHHVSAEQGVQLYRSCGRDFQVKPLTCPTQAALLVPCSPPVEEGRMIHSWFD